MNIFNEKFFKRSPKLGYQYKVEFNINGFNDDGTEFKMAHDEYYPRLLSTCVNGVTIPSVKGKVTPYNSFSFYNAVEYDFSDMSLIISFEENDDMVVNKLLMHMLSSQRASMTHLQKNGGMYYRFLPNAYMNTFIRNGKNLNLYDFLDIFVFEMDPNKNNSENYKSGIVHVFNHCYVIKSENVSMEYVESPKGVTMNIEFGFLRYHLESIGGESYIDNIDLEVDAKETRRKIIDELSAPKHKSDYDKSFEKHKEVEDKNYSDLLIPDEEVKEVWDKMSNEQKAAFDMDIKIYEKTIKENANEMDRRLVNVKKELEKHGIHLSINDYNGLVHAFGLGVNGRGSHIMGTNVDLNITQDFEYTNSKGEVVKETSKVIHSSMTKELQDIIEKAFDDNGMYASFEKKPNGVLGDSSFWIHGQMKDGMVYDKSTGTIKYGEIGRYVQAGKVHNASTKKDEDLVMTQKKRENEVVNGSDSGKSLNKKIKEVSLLDGVGNNIPKGFNPNKQDIPILFPDENKPKEKKVEK